MPVVALPNGETVQFPEGTSPDVMSSALSAYVKENPAAGQPPAQDSPAQAPQEPAETPSEQPAPQTAPPQEAPAQVSTTQQILDKLAALKASAAGGMNALQDSIVHGMTLGADDYVKAAGDWAAHKLAGDAQPFMNYHAIEQNKREDQDNAYPVTSMAGNIAGSIVGAPAGTVGRGAKALLTNLGVGAAQGALNSDADSALEVARDAAIGAGANTALPAALGKAASYIGNSPVAQRLAILPLAHAIGGEEGLGALLLPEEFRKGVSDFVGKGVRMAGDATDAVLRSPESVVSKLEQLLKSRAQAADHAIPAELSPHGMMWGDSAPAGNVGAGPAEGWLLSGARAAQRAVATDPDGRAAVANEVGEIPSVATQAANDPASMIALVNRTVGPDQAATLQQALQNGQTAYNAEVYKMMQNPKMRFLVQHGAVDPITNAI